MIVRQYNVKIDTTYMSRGCMFIDSSIAQTSMTRAFSNAVSGTSRVQKHQQLYKVRLGTHTEHVVNIAYKEVSRSVKSKDPNTSSLYESLRKRSSGYSLMGFSKASCLVDDTLTSRQEAKFSHHPA